MSETWEEHCPFDEGDQPAERQAFREGWLHRMEDGPDEDGLDEDGPDEDGSGFDLDVASERVDRMSNLSTFIAGYVDACKHLGDERIEFVESDLVGIDLDSTD